MSKEKAISQVMDLLDVVDSNENSLFTHSVGHMWVVDGYITRNKTHYYSDGSTIIESQNLVNCNWGWGVHEKNGYYISGAFDARYNSSFTAGNGEIDITTYSQQFGATYNFAYCLTMLPNVNK